MNDKNSENISPHILVLGCGYVADYFKKFKEYQVVPKQPIEQLENLIKNSNCVINAHEIQEGNTQELLKENYLFVQELYLLCERNNKKLVHISTANLYNDFDWQNNTEENNNLNLNTDYLISKRIAERVLESTDSIIMRIKNPFDGRFYPDNWLVRALNKKKVSNWVDTHTYIPDLEKSARKLIHVNARGIFNTVQTQSGSDLFYFNSVLKLPKYSKYSIGKKKDKRYDSIIDPKYPYADVNNTKLQQYNHLTDCTAAVILSWAILKEDIDSALIC